MTLDGPRFLMGLEQECLTVCQPGEAESPRRLVAAYAQLAPSLYDASGAGCFNAYGRVYIDAGPHVEIATAEADSPLALVRFVEQQQTLMAIAVANLARRGWRLTLANNNHSGLLTRATATWGSHSNFLVPTKPSLLANRLLPFLATCPFGGAGGILFPTGQYLNSVRSLFMANDTGEGATGDRAIITDERRAHLSTAGSPCYRLHVISFDGQRSQFGICLRFGATDLVLKALVAKPSWTAPLPNSQGGAPGRFWAAAMQTLNQLAEPGEPPRVKPLALDVQQWYLDGVRRWTDAIADLPEWVPKIIQAWEQTLSAMRNDDQPWLARRLDPWIKFDLFTAWLVEARQSWRDLPGNPQLFAELALLDQQYHRFCDSDSPFDRLDRAGLLDQRMVENLPPGQEHEQFVPDVGTRARARARFLRDHDGDLSMRMSWCYAARLDCDSRRLDDPFALEYSPWTGGSADPIRRGG